MLAGTKTETIATAAEDWLARFELALAQPEIISIGALFHDDSYWRDVLALTWRIQTIHGRDAIEKALKAHAGRAKLGNLRLARDRTAPRRVPRAGARAIEAIFDLETADGRGSGVLRLTPDPSDGNALKAWTLMTSLDELRGHEEHVGNLRPDGESYSREFHGPNWLDLRKSAAEYTDRDPAVLVVGGGQAGLSIAARLKQLQIDTLVVDRWPRIGDNWRRRYHALTLHNQVHVNHLPYMPFPPNWPTYIPKDKLANWFEFYTEAMELNYWTGTEFEGGIYDDKTRRWTVTLRKLDGTKRTMHPRHVVMATGVSGVPNLPDIPSLQNFTGTVLHSGQYEDGESWKGKNAIVIGSGNSGHDIAQDLHSGGANVTLVQRGSTMVIQIEPSAQLPYAIYEEGPPLDDCDLVTVGMPFALARQSHNILTEKARKLDKELLERLERIGFKLDFGDGGAGWQFKYLTRGGGYYFNVGCSDLLVDGKVGFLQFQEIDEFVAEGARLRNGKTLPVDLVVLATGYKGQDALVRKLFGDAMADRVGPIWDFDEQQELRNMFVRTAQPGLWFIAGSFAQSRIYSKFLALQIKAQEIGLLP